MAWVTTEAVYRMESDGTLSLIRSEGYDYAGPVAMAGGGPSKEQKAAATAQANLANTSAANATQAQQQVQDQYKKIDPFATNRMNNGLSYNNALTDFASGQNAQAYAPAGAALNRSLTNYGSLPSGFATQAHSDFNANRARGFDASLTQNLAANDLAKTNAAGMLVGQQQIAAPQGWTQAASQGNNSVMNAPLATPGAMGAIGGLMGSLGSAAITKF